jgi:hypothetical protein
MESEHPICSTEQTQVMCTEVGRNKKKCSGGGAGQVGVQDKGFYGSTVQPRSLFLLRACNRKYDIKYVVLCGRMQRTTYFMSYFVAGPT